MFVFFESSQYHIYILYPFIKNQFILMIRILILSLSLSSILAEVVSNNLRSDSVNDQPSQNQNGLLTSDFEQNQLPIIIGLSVWGIFNCLVAMMLLCRQRRDGIYGTRVQKGLIRQNFGQRYPEVRFQTVKGFGYQRETFYGRDCYEIGEVVASIPVFIYGRDIAAEVNQLDNLTIYQCQNCRGLTKTLEVFKYGRLKSCKARMFILIYLPCIVVPTIFLLVAKRILWQKHFCAECGLEKKAIPRFSSDD